jgi:hypothetical protein
MTHTSPRLASDTWAASSAGAADQAGQGAELARALARIQRQCGAIRARMPAVAWDLAVIEITAGAAVDRGCRAVDADVICRRLAEVRRCFASLSEDLAALTDAAVQLGDRPPAPASASRESAR